MKTHLVSNILMWLCFVSAFLLILVQVEAASSNPTPRTVSSVTSITRNS